MISDYSPQTRIYCYVIITYMTKDLRKSIGGVLRTKREKLGISQEEVADRAGVDRTYISILERGLKSPTIETFERICSALQTLPECVIEKARRNSHE
jgi:transcriptional regulator with XRE-family HTH domain